MQASLELQRALVAALSADPAIQGLGLGLFDGPPADAPSPYLSVGADQLLARGWQGGVGHEHRLQLMLWDARPGFARVKAMMAEVERVVLAMPRDISGGRLVSLRLLRGTVRRAARNWTQGTLEFRALTVKETDHGG